MEPLGEQEATGVELPSELVREPAAERSCSSDTETWTGSFWEPPPGLSEDPGSGSPLDLLRSSSSLKELQGDVSLEQPGGSEGESTS